MSADKKETTRGVSGPDAIPRGLLIGVLAGLTGLSLIVRIWSFVHTSGMLFGVGTEEAFRLYVVQRSLIKPMVAPFQMWAGRFVLWFFPETVYVTRWISLFAGVLSPALLFLAMRRGGFFIAAGAAAALAISPLHILFSNVGTAESLNFALLFLCLIGLLQADIARFESGSKSEAAWMALSVAAFSAALLTRFENWSLIPIILAAALLRRRAASWIWAAVLAVPAWWFLYSKKHFTSTLSSADLIPRSDPLTAYRNVQAISSDALQWLGWAGCALSAIGIGYLLWKKGARLLPIFAAAIVATFLVMLRTGRVWSDPKYGWTLAVWGQIFIGAGIGAILTAVNAVLDRSSKPDESQNKSRIVILGCVAGPVILFSIFSAAALKQNAESYFSQWRTGGRDKAFLAELESLPSPAQQRFEIVDFLTSARNNDFIKIYTRPGRSDQYKPATRDEAKSVRKELTDIFSRTQSKKDLPGLVVTESGALPKDDLSESDCVAGFPIKRIFSKYGFRVYEVDKSDAAVCP